MSEKEKAMLEKIAALPDPIKEKFIDRLDGARIALDVLGVGGAAANPAPAAQEEKRAGA